jgi:hypothetical protein
VTLRLWKLAAVCITLGVFASPVLAQVAYLDAMGGFGGNTLRASNLSPDDWFVTDAAANDNLWNFRATQGNAGIFQSVDSSTYVEDAPELVTTAAGLANGTYDVYVFYRSEAGSNNWKVRAGFTSNPGANPLYDRTGTGGATAGTLALSGPGALTFAGTPPVEDNPQLLYYAVIGQYNVTDGNLSVYIDDLPGASPSQLLNRTWYEGIGYAMPTVTLEIDSVQTGNAQTASTWSNNQPPAPTNNYNVIASHIVTVDQPFTGKRLTAQNGGTVNIGASQVDVRYLKVATGGALTESVSGSWTLGDQFASLSLGFLELEGDVAFNADPGGQLTLALSVLGAGNLTYNSNGAGSELIVADAQDHDGTIFFNGTGDGVRMVHNRMFGRVEMNSTGANRFIFETTDQVGTGVLIFNEAGVVDHASSVAGSRLIMPSVLEANAPVTVDLTKTFTGDERRLSFGDAIRGAADITVNGTATDPFNPGGGSNGTTLNEFELGGTGEPSGAIPNNSYSGTLTANNYVNVELRHSLRSARVVVNANAMLDTGHQVVNTAKAIELGEVVINNGGTLEVGFTQSTMGGSSTGHHVSHLVLDDSSGRTGSLTLNDGATTVMQVNGTDVTHHDTIDADGSIALNGTLRVLVNPLSTNNTANPIYAPTLGEVITLMTAAGGSAPTTDFDSSGTVDGGDLTTWRGAFGPGSTGGDADGDGDTDGADFLAWQQDVGATGGGGGITGSFDSLLVDDPTSTMANAGLAFQLQVTSSQVNLVVVAAGPVAAVPEPTAALLGAAGAVGLAAARRRRRESV